MGKRGRPPELQAPRDNAILRMLVDAYKDSGLSQEQFFDEAGVRHWKRGKDAGTDFKRPAQAVRDTVRRNYKIHVGLVNYILSQTLLAKEPAQLLRNALLVYGLEPEQVAKAIAYCNKLKGAVLVRDIPNRSRLVDHKG